MATPKVTLVQWTPDPKETLFVLWEASKNEGPLLSVEQVKRDQPKNIDGETPETLFWKVLKQRIPVGEMLQFTFMMENVSVSWREQAVRHRIGTKVGDAIGVDIIPDLADSSWWSQSMRIQNMGAFADNEAYRVPPSLGDKRVKFAGAEMSAGDLFHATMKAIQMSYNALVEAAVPMEDARELIPLGAQHRISWTMNLASLLHIVGKRGCWILQMGLWGPVITGMIQELAKKVHPAFLDLVKPPCIGADGKFNACQYQHENERRITQEDKLPICPLYVVRDSEGAKRHFGGSSYKCRYCRGEGLSPCECGPSGTPEGRAAQVKANLAPVQISQHPEMTRRAEEYRALWGHDPYTWEKEQT